MSTERCRVPATGSVCRIRKRAVVISSARFVPPYRHWVNFISAASGTAVGRGGGIRRDHTPGPFCRRPAQRHPRTHGHADRFIVEFFQPVKPLPQQIPAVGPFRVILANGWQLCHTRFRTLHCRAKQNRITGGRKRIRITVSDLKAGYVYSLSTTGKLAKSEKLWPAEAHYSMKVVPE